MELNDKRKKRLAYNTLSSICLQLVNVISSFIVPRLILSAFGSEINGLVNSITQFLGVITFLDLGVGAVVKSSLYAPLSNNDDETVSKIYLSASRFFKKIAIIMLGYSIILVAVYPLFFNKFDYIYTATLIIAIFISTFAQYYFGIVNSLLLTAHQRGYIQYFAQIATIVLNTAACAVLIYFKASIQIVKLTTSIIFFIRPVFLSVYVKKNYKINKDVQYTEEPIKQKWNGLAQHIADVVLNNTDNIVLTFFSTLANVSIYSVYNLVILGIKTTILYISNGFTSLLGEMLAKDEKIRLLSFFSYVEWLFHTISVIIFGCCGVLIVSFVQVYTSGITDANYKQPLFAVLISLAYGFYGLRLPYNILILAAGHYKQTQRNYIIAMVLNIVISIATVKFWGLIGVAIGTLVAMAYQTAWMAWYDSKNIINWPFKKFLKQCAVDFTTVIIAVIATFKIPLLTITYKAWFVQAIEVFVCWSAVVVIMNLIFYRDKLTFVVGRIGNKIKR